MVAQWFYHYATVFKDAIRVLNIATDKHAGMDQYFCEFEDYVLLYPDIKVCNLLPGSNESCTVERI